MQRPYTKDFIFDTVKLMDTRAKKLTDEEIHAVIDDGYSEMAAIYHLFSNQEVIDLAPIYESQEVKFTIEIEEDVVDVYEIYLTVENQSFDLYEHGIKKIDDRNAIYSDNRMMGVVHINLSQTDEVCDNAVIKYFYTPDSTDEVVYMDKPTFLAAKNAFHASLLDKFHDTERYMQKLAAVKRTVNAAIPKDPHDLIGTRDSIFPGGVINGL